MTVRLTREQIAEALRSGRRIAPSQHDPWTGTKAEGEIFTAEQIGKLKEAGKDPAHIAIHAISLTIPCRHNPLGATETIHADCPIIARTRRAAPHARVLIITPAGDSLWVNAQPGHSGGDYR